MARLVIVTLEAAEARAIRTLAEEAITAAERGEPPGFAGPQTVATARAGLRKLTKEIERAERVKVRE